MPHSKLVALALALASSPSSPSSSSSASAASGGGGGSRDSSRVGLAAPCVSDANCSLNGACDVASGVCACRAPWTDAACATLALKPAPAAWPAYGRNATRGAPALSSWGGLPLFLDNAWHLYVSEIAGGCSLANWTSNSHCIHAVGSSVTGPFAFSDVAVGVFCHNAAPIQDPVTGALWLFHIGDGSEGAPPKNCSSAEPPGPAAPRRSAAAAAPAGSVLHFARSPGGPWLPALNLTGLPKCNNVAPAVLRNSSWAVLCHEARGAARLFLAPHPTGPWAAADGAGIDMGLHDEDPLYVPPPRTPQEQSR